ncbi:MAG: SRPBCC family protein [Thermoanaerobaculia bacterium]
MIDMQTDSDSIRGSLYIEAPPETVFRALTDTKQLLQWWGSETTYRCRDWSADPRPGGKWRSQGHNASGAPFSVEGEYTQVDPPCLLAYTWKPSWVDAPATLVRWEFAPEGRGTRVTMAHTGFAGHSLALADHRKGWPGVAGWLTAWCESRAPIKEPGPALKVV